MDTLCCTVNCLVGNIIYVKLFCMQKVAVTSCRMHISQTATLCRSDGCSDEEETGHGAHLDHLTCQYQFDCGKEAIYQNKCMQAVTQQKFIYIKHL